MSQEKRWPTGIRPSGKGLQIRLWADGEVVYQETLHLNPRRKSDVAVAVRRRKWLVARLASGLGLGPEEDPISLFRDVAQEYLNTLEAKAQVIIEYHRMLNHWWMPELGKRPIQDVTSAHIKRILSKMPVTSKTKKNRLIPLYGVLKHAEIQPPRIKLRKHQKEPVERYTPAERGKLLKKLEGAARIYFTLLFGCGLRPGEALALQWSDFDGECLKISKQITSRRIEPTTKTSVRRKVYVPQWVRDALRTHPSHITSPYLFNNSFGRPHLDTDRFNAKWKIAHTKARISYRVPYICRHTRAAELLSIGITPPDAAKQLGHSTEMFYRVYSEFIEEYMGEKDMSRFDGTRF
jgi:integrase